MGEGELEGGGTDRGVSKKEQGDVLFCEQTKQGGEAMGEGYEKMSLLYALTPHMLFAGAAVFYLLGGLARKDKVFPGRRLLTSAGHAMLFAGFGLLMMMAWG
jgi:hypothetical protein